MKRSLLSSFAALIALAPLALAQDGGGDRPAEPRKPQSAVASKTASFGQIAAADGSVSKALQADDLDGAKALIGKSGAFTGTVSAVFAPKSNAIVILNFADDYKKALSAVVEGKNFAAFPDLRSLKGKKVLISGKFEAFKGRPQILLKSPEQVKLIK